jgi:serine/threonine-protein kinase MRCK
MNASFSLLQQLHGQVDEYRADSNKERKLRERAEQYSRELEQEIEAAKRKNLNRGPTASHLEMSQEISRCVSLIISNDN